MGTEILSRIVRRVTDSVASRLVTPDITPAFILGCGRSGKTTLGRALSYHPEVTYLDEPRHLWIKCYPITDIWSAKSEERGGRLNLTEKDVEPKRSKKIRSLFHYEIIKSKRPCLIENLPINTFRLSFIQTIFPESKYIHVLRNGIEVAKSIDKAAKRGRWYGHNDYKWNQIADYAKARADTRHLPTICRSNYERGLLEWRLSVESMDSFAKTISNESFIEISFAELMGNPVETIKKILSFLRLNESDEVNAFAQENIKRRSQLVANYLFSDAEKEILGAMIPRMEF